MRDPMIIGHESAGTVIDVGDGVDRNRVGELVALDGRPVPNLHAMPAGRYNLCPRVVHAACGRIDQPFLAIDAAFAHSALRG